MVIHRQGKVLVSKFNNSYPDYLLYTYFAAITNDMDKLEYLFAYILFKSV